MAKEKNQGVWFDGVDKKLLDIHTMDKANIVKGDDRNLMTKTPLVSFSSFTKTKNGKSKPTDPKRPKIVNDRKTSNGDLMRPNTSVTEELAMDCEMVECYHHKSVLARVSIVNLFGHPILDRYVAPPSKVTDYRTRYSGIRRKDLINAPDFDTVQQEVINLIKGRILVGHALHNDIGVLKITHPSNKIRDTSEYFKYLFQGKTPSLKKLSETVLGVSIQKGEHDSVQDAQATMKLYVKERDKWNQRLMKSSLNQSRPNKSKQKKKPMKKKTKTFYVLTT